MKTIQIVFFPKADLPLEKAKLMNNYSFNTKDDLRVGNVLKSEGYTSYMIVVAIRKETITATEEFRVKELSCTGKPRTIGYKLVKPEPAFDDCDGTERDLY
jgi:hypothetical protein